MSHSNRYEALMLTVPEITEDETKSIKQQLDRIIAEKQGSTIAFDRWGKFRLSYPVDNNEYGVYFLARFETDNPEPLLSEIRALLGVKLHELVMRFIVAKLDPKQPLTYQRPQSLEEAPAREVGAFMKESKADTLMGHDDSDSDVQEL